jgi:hypothetical protein
MAFKRIMQRIPFRDLVYGLVGALLAAVNCYIAAIIYPQMPEFVFVIVIALGFLAGCFFGSTAVVALLTFLGAV